MLLRAGLVDGALLSAFMTLVVLGSLRHDPRIWTDDAPPALREQLGPMPRETVRRKWAWGVVMLIGLIAISTHLMITGLPAEAGFVERALVSYVMFETFNLYDAIVLDIGVILLWAPQWAFVPGTRRHPALLDWRFHVRAFLTGVVAGVPFSLVVAGCWAICSTMAAWLAQS